MVEILLTSYNGEKYIRAQLDSIIAQDTDEWHITLSDDGSTDSTKEIIEEYIEKYPDKISLVQAQKSFGNARDHFFWLMEQCEAQYMMLCDQDDVWKENKVNLTVSALKKAEAAGTADVPVLVFTDETPVDDGLNKISDSLVSYQNMDVDNLDWKALTFSNAVTGNTVGFNKALKDMAVECLHKECVIMHDWWLAVVAARFGRIVYIDKSTVLYRQHGDNSNGIAATRTVDYTVDKVKDLDGVKAQIYRKKQQAKTFLDTYKNRLDPEDEEFLNAFAKHHSGMSFYMKYGKCIKGWKRKAGMAIIG